MSAPELFETWCTAWAAGALHALKPGAYVAAFGGARTWHRMVRGIENAGFEIRDQIAWLHTTGMPKSMDLSHAIDKHHGVHRADRIVQTGLLRVWLSRGVYAASVTASIIMVSNSTGVSFPSRRCRRLRW